MKILIVSATHLEIEPLVRKLKFRKQLTANLTRYSYKQYIIDILISGVGMDRHLASSCSYTLWRYFVGRHSLHITGGSSKKSKPSLCFHHFKPRIGICRHRRIPVAWRNLKQPWVVGLLPDVFRYAYRSVAI